MLSTKDLKWQIKGRRTEKLTEQFVGPYKVKRIVLTNTIELKLPSTIKIHLVVNISRVQLYKPQVEGQKVVPLQLVVIDGKKEYEVKNLKQKEDTRKGQVSSLIEGVYSRSRYMERMRKFRKCERVG